MAGNDGLVPSFLSLFHQGQDHQNLACPVKLDPSISGASELEAGTEDGGKSARHLGFPNTVVIPTMPTYPRPTVVDNRAAPSTCRSQIASKGTTIVNTTESAMIAQSSDETIGLELAGIAGPRPAA